MADSGFNFRDTALYVADGTGEQFVNQDGFDNTYPVTAGGETFGWEDDLEGQDAFDESNSVDRRLAGVHLPRANSTVLTFRTDRASSGSKTTRVAQGAAVDGNGYEKGELFDDNSSLGVCVLDTDGHGGGSFYDIAGTLHASAAAWVSSNASRTDTFSSTIVRYRIGDAGAGARTYIAHFFVSDGGGGGASAFPQPYYQQLRRRAA